MNGGEVAADGFEGGVGWVPLRGELVAVEKVLSAEIGGREAVVILAPMGAHHAIGFEAWQAVVTDDVGVALAVRDRGAVGLAGGAGGGARDVADVGGPGPRLPRWR